MVLKILLLVAAAAGAWFLTRPRPPKKLPPDETALVQCKHCGVYHPPSEPCRCQK
ncbi:MAG: hypothetical protein HAW59_04305 [Betaproteobacteria bacterium]|nr:hypothetical protein [Betaproteobacteria bacterium]